MNKKYTSVAFLLSKENNWIEKYFQNSTLKKEYEDIKIFYDESMIKEYEIVFVLGYMKILDSNFLKRNKHNLVIHESALPFGKGFSPVQWQILEGANKITVSLIEANNNVDGGDIILQSELKLHGLELYNEIRLKQAEVTFNLISEFLKKYPNHKRIKQVGEGSFFPKRNPEDGELDINKTIKEQFNKLRIGNNDSWPSFFKINGKKFIIKIYNDENN